MTRSSTVAALLVCAALVSPVAAAQPSAETVRFFEGKVRPLLVEHCQTCHGAKKQSGGLRLDSAEALRTGGDSGPVVVPGKPDESLLIRAIRHEGDLKMPRKPLAAADVAILTEWVRQGAPWPTTTTIVRGKGTITAEDRAYWAYQPIRDPAVPVVKQSALARTPIDHFLLARLEARGLSFAPRADRRTLIRRVTFDLTGLPPTPDEVDAFARDRGADAYERLIDRLLASPAYGERWGRHWLDVVRYADTAGDNSDYPVPQLYRYRNWVLAAFNADQPYDEFLREQIAGDLLPAATEEQKRERIIATGYLAGTRRFGSYEDKRYQWWLTFEDTIENLGRTVLGLGLSCARCHDHKFDPISMEDYYALYGFFQSTRFPWPGIELDKVQRDLVPLAPQSEMAAAQRERQQQLDELDGKIRALKPEQKKEKQQLTRRRENLARMPLPVESAYAVAEGQRWVGNARVQMRGDPTRLGKEVPRRFLQILGGQELPGDVKGSGRLHLANWLSDARNPLTARVLVNRLWQYHFGRGIVPTPNDFGRQGRPPAHPELLDWLATHFIRSGWSIKRMHRVMLLSTAYQMSGQTNEAARSIDPENELLGHYPRRRLDAESIRDSLLVLGGALDRSVGGPHPFPPMASWDFTQHKPFKAVYDTDRRSVYLMTQRIQRHPYLALFDGADTNASTGRRGSSTTPLQALYLMNDPFVHRMARGFAERLLHERKEEDERIEYSFRLALARAPRAEERDAARQFLARAREKVASAGLSGSEGAAQAWHSYAHALFLSNELVYVD